MMTVHTQIEHTLLAGAGGETPDSSFPWHEIDGSDDIKTVCLFSDDELFRAGCEQVLADAPQLDLKLSAGSVSRERAMRFINASSPAVIIVGIARLTHETLAFLTDLHAEREETGIIVVFGSAPASVMHELRVVSTRIRSGFACVGRDSIASGQHLIQLIDAVSDHRILLDQGIMERLLSAESQGNAVAAKLSNREGEVMELMATGLTNPGIAEALCLERKTVERHINSIYNKLDDSAEGHPRVNTILAYLRASGRLDAAA